MNGLSQVRFSPSSDLHRRRSLEGPSEAYYHHPEPQQQQPQLHSHSQPFSTLSSSLGVSGTGSSFLRPFGMTVGPGLSEMDLDNKPQLSRESSRSNLAGSLAHPSSQFVHNAGGLPATQHGMAGMRPTSPSNGMVDTLARSASDLRSLTTAIEKEGTHMSSDIVNLREDMRAQFEAISQSLSGGSGSRQGATANSRRTSSGYPGDFGVQNQGLGPAVAVRQMAGDGSAAPTAAYDAVSRSFATTTANMGGYPAAQAGGSYQHLQPQPPGRTAEDMLVRVESTIATMRDMHEQEKQHLVSRIATLESRLASLEGSQSENNIHAERLYGVMDRRLRECLERADHLTAQMDRSLRIGSDNSASLSTVVPRLNDAETAVRITQERLETQIQWGNQLEETTAVRIEEIQKAVLGVRNEVTILQRVAARFEEFVRAYGGRSGAGGEGGKMGESNGEMRHALELVENEISVLHRRLTNALRVFNIHPSEPLISTEEDLFLIRSGASPPTGGSGNSNSNSNSASPRYGQPPSMQHQQTHHLGTSLPSVPVGPGGGSGIRHNFMSSF